MAQETPGARLWRTLFPWFLLAGGLAWAESSYTAAGCLVAIPIVAAHVMGRSKF